MQRPKRCSRAIKLIGALMPIDLHYNMATEIQMVPKLKNSLCRWWLSLWQTIDTTAHERMEESEKGGTQDYRRWQRGRSRERTEQKDDVMLIGWSCTVPVGTPFFWQMYGISVGSNTTSRKTFKSHITSKPSVRAFASVRTCIKSQTGLVSV